MRIGGLVKLADLEYAKRSSSDKDSHGQFHYLLESSAGSDTFTGHSPLHGLRSGIAQLPLPRIVTIQNLFCSAFHVNLRDLHSYLTLFTTSSHCGGSGFGSCTSMPLKMVPPNKLKHFDHCSPITCPPSGCLTSSPKTDVHLAFRDVIRCAEIVCERLVKAYLDMGISLPPDYHQEQRRLLQFLNSLRTRHSKNSNAEVNPGVPALSGFLRTLQLAVDRAGNTKLYIPPEHRQRKEPEQGSLSSSNSDK